MSKLLDIVAVLIIGFPFVGLLICLGMAFSDLPVLMSRMVVLIGIVGWAVLRMSPME